MPVEHQPPQRLRGDRSWAAGFEHTVTPCPLEPVVIDYRDADTGDLVVGHPLVQCQPRPAADRPIQRQAGFDGTDAIGRARRSQERAEPDYQTEHDRRRHNRKQRRRETAHDPA